MSGEELADVRDWLETDESRSVGQKDGGGEATGHTDLLRCRNDAAGLSTVPATVRGCAPLGPGWLASPSS